MLILIIILKSYNGLVFCNLMWHIDNLAFLVHLSPSLSPLFAWYLVNCSWYWCLSVLILLKKPPFSFLFKLGVALHF